LLKPDISDDFDNVQVLGANMSALGLSQKPIYTHGKHCSYILWVYVIEQ